MTVRSKRLFVGASGVAGVSTTLYTVPAGKTTILKDVRLNGRADPSSTFIFFSGSGPFLTYLATGTLNINATLSLQGFIVLGPGDRLGVNASIGSGIGLHLSGSELDGVAP